MRRAALLLALAAAAPALAASGAITLRNDPAKARIAPAEGEAVVVVLLDDPERSHIRIQFQAYDVAARKLVMPAKGEKRVYAFGVGFARVGSVAQDVGAYVGVVPAGDYVLLGDVWPEPQVDSFCFAAPVMHVAAGSVSFVGGYRPTLGKHFTNRLQQSALGWSGDLDQARLTLAAFPSLRERLVAAPVTNGATFDCSGDHMWAYRVPGAPDLPDAPDEPAPPPAASAADARP